MSKAGSVRHDGSGGRRCACEAPSTSIGSEGLSPGSRLGGSLPWRPLVWIAAEATMNGRSSSGSSAGAARPSLTCRPSGREHYRDTNRAASAPAGSKRRKGISCRVSLDVLGVVVREALGARALILRLLRLHDVAIAHVPAGGAPMHREVTLGLRPIRLVWARFAVRLLETSSRTSSCAPRAGAAASRASGTRRCDDRVVIPRLLVGPSACEGECEPERADRSK